MGELRVAMMVVLCGDDVTLLFPVVVRCEGGFSAPMRWSRLFLPTVSSALLLP